MTYPQVLFENRKPDRIVTLEEYRGNGGYTALAGVVGKHAPREVSLRGGEDDLRGRGGAGFPAAKKWLAVPEDGAFPRYLAANCDEMEPGTLSQASFLRR